MNNRIVFFDAANTLLHLKRSVREIYAEFASKHGEYINPQSLKTPLKQVWQDMTNKYHDNKDMRYGVDVESSKMWWREFVGRVLKQARFNGDIGVFFDELYYYFGSAEPWEVYDDAIETINKLKILGYKSGIISNWDHRLKGLLKDIGLDKLMDHIIISSFVGYEKPDRRIFEYALTESKTLPEDAYHIGDSFQEDIVGALNVGINPIFIKRDKEFGINESWDKIKVKVVKDLRAIIDFID
jgi:putative hydrolase of the HAD superfamily